MAENFSRRVFVTDFDGTISGQDFYQLVARQYMPKDAPDYWSRFARGELSHFEAMGSFFSHAPENPEDLDRLLDQMDMDPNFATAIHRLRECGCEVVIASAGSSWYIERLLQRAGVAGLAVHASPGSIEPGRGLLIRLPDASPFLSPGVGIDKSAIVRDALNNAGEVAFAGDGPPDIEPALLVHPRYRFARGWLADELRRRGQDFHPFSRWSEIAGQLVR